MAKFSQSALQESIMIITQLPEVEKAKKKKIPRNLGISIHLILRHRCDHLLFVPQKQGQWFFQEN